MKAGPCRAGRHQEIGGAVLFDPGQGTSVDLPHARRMPLGHAAALLRALEVAGDGVGDGRLDAPAAVGVPALVPQEIGDRRKHVRRRAPDVAVTVAVSIHGVFEVVGRQELGLAERARP